MPIYFPSVSWAVPAAVTPAPTLNATAASPQETQLTVAASNAPLRVIYGQVRSGAQIANVVPYGNSWIVQAIWGEGPIDSIVSCQFNDEAVPAGVSVTHYLGEAAPTVNATLVAAFAANGQAYTDTLPSIAYSVFSIPAGDIGLPQINAVIKGRKVRNPGSSVAWSDNPALCLADFLESTTYGLGRTVADAGLIAARDACDALVSGVKRRTIGLVLDSVQGVSQWVDTLRTYAGCWVVMDESTALLIPDRPRSTDAAFLHASGQIAKLGNLKKRGVAQAPTVIEIRYTDTSLFPWREASVWAYAPGVGSTVSRRDSQVALPGIQNASQAQREANERLNKLWLADLSFALDVFDDGARLQLGDVIEITHPIGLDAKKMRVLGINGDYGRYSLNLSEYDPACYSDTVISDPTYSDTNLPSPANPPAVTGLVASEEVFQLENGTYSSRIRLTWDAPEWPYLHDYVVTIEQAGNAIDMRRQTATTYASAAVQEGVEYVCKVAVISSIGATGTVAQDNITPLGKYMLPNPVPSGSLTAFEAGGTVYLSWGQATDIDIWRYRLKRGTTAQSYAQATQIDLVDALRYQDKTTPVGTWRFWVDVVDSVQQESGTPRYVDVVVTSDASALLVDSYDQTAPQWQNRIPYSSDFASWSPTATISSNSTVAPDGTTTADTITDSDAATWGQCLGYISGAVANTPLGFAVCIKRDTTGRATRFPVIRIMFVGGASYVDAKLDTATGEYSSVAVGAAVLDSVGVLDYGGGYWIVWVSGHHATLAANYGAVYPSAGASAAWSYSAAATGSVIAWGARVFDGLSPPMYTETGATALTSGGLGMAEFSLARTDANLYFVTEDSVAFGTKFSSNLSTYTNALATYHASMTSTLVGESEDFGSLLGGQWSGTATVSALTGSLTSYMGFSTDGSSWSYLSGLSQKTNARFSRLKHESLTTSTLMVTIPTQNIRLDAIPRTESGSGTSSAEGPVTVTLENDYIATKKLTITPSGTTARSAIYDNIVLGNPTTFDVYVFNDSGVKIASPFMYDWQGV